MYKVYIKVMNIRNETSIFDFTERSVVHLIIDVRGKRQTFLEINQKKINNTGSNRSET